MNILEQEDLIKGLPDQALFQQAENPTGEVPQFLVISEIQRRNDMRKRFEASEPQPQTTAAERIVREGLGAFMPPQNSLPPPAMPAPPSTSVSHLEGSSPLMGQGMAAGGILSFKEGGDFPDLSGDGKLTKKDVLIGRGVINKAGGGVLGFNPGGQTKRQQIISQSQAAARAQAQIDEYNRRNEREQFQRNYPGAGREELIDLITPTLDRTKFSNPVSRRKEAMRQADQRIADYESGAISYEQMFGEEYSSVDSPAPVVSELTNYSEVEGAPIPSEFLPRSFGDVDIGNIAEMDITKSPAVDVLEYTGEADYGGQGDANSVLTNLGEDEQNILALAKNELGDKITVPRLDLEKPDLSSDVETLDTQSLLDSIEAQRTGITDRLDARRSESQELINQIREEGKRDALSAALIQLGAGISSGDMASGLSQAGSAMTSANALARDAARAEQRSMRDYEEAALAQADLLGVEGQRFAYEEAKDAAVRKQALAQWDAEHGLRQDSLALEAAFKQAGLDQDYDQFKSGLVMQVSEIAAKAKSDNNTTRREAMRTFTSYMNTIRDVVDDLPASMDADKKIQTVKDMQRQMIDALKVELGSDFFNAFAREAQEEAASPSSGEELSIEEIMSRYPGQ
tara:strand:+ start:522 stop:2405 length:1884 start_codon:yes stop_codon:yes gene_type:complete